MPFVQFKTRDAQWWFDLAYKSPVEGVPTLNTWLRAYIDPDPETNYDMVVIAGRSYRDKKYHEKWPEVAIPTTKIRIDNTVELTMHKNGRKADTPPTTLLALLGIGINLTVEAGLWRVGGQRLQAGMRLDLATGRPVGWAGEPERVDDPDRTKAWRKHVADVRKLLKVRVKTGGFDDLLAQRYYSRFPSNKHPRDAELNGINAATLHAMLQKMDVDGLMDAMCCNRLFYDVHGLIDKRESASAVAAAISKKFDSMYGTRRSDVELLAGCYAEVAPV